MRPLRLTVTRCFVAAGIVAAGITFDIVPAAAWTEGVCPTAEGVTVVVDFQELGGGVNVRCATGNLPTGFAALDAAGINYQTTVRFSGFLCKIAGLPSNDPCINASPATAYWSYWLAPRGGQWCYSNWGAGNRTPPPGSVEGWSFSLNKNASTSPPPRLAVPAAVPGSPGALPANDCDQSATAPKPATPATPSTSPPPTSPPATAPSATGPPATNAPGATPSPTVAPSPRAGAPGTTIPSVVRSETTVAGATTLPGATTTTLPGETTTLPETMSTVAGRTDDATTTTTVSIDDAQLAGSIDLGGGSDDGSPVGVIIAVSLVAILGGAAVAFRRRDRS